LIPQISGVSLSGFAKNPDLRYTQNMNDETTTAVTPEIISNIRDEDQFQDAILAAKGKSETIDGHARYI
jgi:hypothetical protein